MIKGLTETPHYWDQLAFVTVFVGLIIGIIHIIIIHSTLPEEEYRVVSSS